MRIISAFGPPCSLSWWGVEFLTKLFDCAGEAVDFVYKSDVEGLIEAWGGVGDGKACLIYADLPDQPIVDLYLRTNAPLVLFADEPIDLVSYLMRERSTSMRDALGTASQFLATLASFRSRSRTLVISRKSGSLRQFAQDVLELFASDLDAGLREEAVGKIASLYGESDSIEDHCARFGSLGEPTGALVERLAHDERILLRQVLAGYGIVARGGQARRMLWPREVFLRADEPGAHLGGRIELVGGARFLIYGPYLCLPAGAWVATVELEIGDNLSGNHLFVDACGGAEQRLVKLRLPASGLFKFSMPVNVTDSRQSIEMRAVLGEGAIEGWVDWRSVQFTPAGESAASRAADLDDEPARIDTDPASERRRHSAERTL